MESSVGSPGGALLHRNLCPDTIPRNSGTKTQPTDPPRWPMTLKRAPQPQPPMRAAPRGSGRTPAKIGFFHGYGSATQPKVRSTRALTSGWAKVVGDSSAKSSYFFFQLQYHQALARHVVHARFYGFEKLFATERARRLELLATVLRFAADCRGRIPPLQASSA